MAATGRPGRPQERPADEGIERVVAVGLDPKRIKLDEAGYFVIHVEDDALLVEHYDYRERLLRTIEGSDARSVYLTLIRHGWVSRLDHAAYLGKEPRARRDVHEAGRAVRAGRRLSPLAATRAARVDRRMRVVGPPTHRRARR